MVVMTPGFGPGVLMQRLGTAMPWSPKPTPNAEIIYCAPSLDMDDEAFASASRLERIVEACPSVAEPVYKTQPWYAAPVANSALHSFKRAVKASRAAGPPFRLRSEVVPGTSGDLAVVWANDRKTRDLPADAPVVMFMHTITGDADSTLPLLRAASKRGWRGCVLVRRGHAGPLRGEPTFNVLGCTRDAARQVDAVRAAYPDASFRGLVGVSAGSGLLVSYCGQTGHDAKVDAAVSLCPAYDIETAFKSLGETSATVEGLMVGQLKKTFILPNTQLLRAHDETALEACLAATTLDGFIAAHAPFALGRNGAGSAEYYKRANPMEHFEGVRVPTLVVNSEDDMVCRPENIRCDLVRQTAGYALVRTARGSHVAFNEGFFGQGCFMSRLSFDFLDAARATAEEDARVEEVRGVVVPTRTAAKGVEARAKKRVEARV